MSEPTPEWQSPRLDAAARLDTAPAAPTLSRVTLPADYHLHTHLCHHAEGVPADLARRAVEMGLEEIGVSEHSPMPRDDFDDWRMELSRLDEYLAGLEAARREFPQLRILAALEVDYLPGHEDWIR